MEKEMIIEYNRIDRILYEIKKAILELEEIQGVYPMYIKIAIPLFLQRMIEKRNMDLLGNYSVSNSNPDLIYGKEIIPHYQNEIVVFDEMYNPLKESTYKVIKL